MENNDVRWKQRFQNFEKALQYLEDALNIKQPDMIQRAGIVQFFEMSFELAWNLLKDYLEEQGFIDVLSPRSVLKKALEIRLIQNGSEWMKLLEDRNLTSHTYDEETAIEVEELIRKTYYPMFKKLYISFSQKQNE
jgi:nucleotidyltransferase substrate binding protein (TIGR01987 family)